MQYVLIVLLGIAFWFTGYIAGNANQEVVEKVIYKELPPETTLETVTEFVVATETYYYTELKDFDNYNEFIGWLALQRPQDDPDFDWSWNCGCYAKWLCQKAADDGYFIAYMSVDSDEYYTMFGRTGEGRHAINLAWVGDVRYWIDTTNGNQLYGGY